MKTIHQKLAILTASVFLSVGAFAQTGGSGIYKTAEDFKTGKLSLQVDCKTESHKIKLNDFFGKSYIIVVHEGKGYKFEKKDIYAYQLCNGEIYRFVTNNSEDLILNPKEQILIYKYENNKGIAKGSPKIVQYFFSKDAASPLESLTMENLKIAFPTNHKFHDAMEATFKSDLELVQYDSFHKMYKINRVLEANKQ
jgi:hypothetical protein